MRWWSGLGCMEAGPGMRASIWAEWSSPRTPREYYRKNILFPFFEHYLKGGTDAKLPKAYVFETGTNVWRKYSSWPPENAERKTLYLQAGGGLSFDAAGSEAVLSTNM